MSDTKAVEPLAEKKDSAWRTGGGVRGWFGRQPWPVRTVIIVVVVGPSFGLLFWLSQRGHLGETEVTSRLGVGTKADPVVGEFQDKVVAVSPQRHPRFAGAGMAFDVAQRHAKRRAELLRHAAPHEG